MPDFVARIKSVERCGLPGKEKPIRPWTHRYSRGGKATEGACVNAANPSRCSWILGPLYLGGATSRRAALGAT